MGLKTFALKMTHAEDRIWPCLAYFFQVRSTVVAVSPRRVRPDHTVDYGPFIKCQLASRN